MDLIINKTNWKKVKLGDVAFEYSKRINNPCESGFDKFVGSSNINQWDFRVKSWESTSSVTSAMKLFEPDDYLLVRRSLYASDFRERAPRAHFHGVCSGDILTIKENKDHIAYGFLIGILNSPALWKYVVANGSGSITRRIHWKDLANYEFLLPPKAEQARLAELLWSMDDIIEKEKSMLNCCLVNKAVISKNLLLGKNELKAERKKSPYGDIPNSWKLINLYDLRDPNDRYSFTGGPFGSDLKSQDYTSSGVRVLQLQNIGEGEFLNNYAIYTSDKKADQLKSCNIYPNEIILAKMAPVARCCIIPEFDKRYVMCSDGIRLKVNENNFHVKFVFHAINSDHFKAYAVSKSSGTTRSRIGLNDLKLIPIPIPTKEKQIEISNKLDSIDNTRDSIKRKISASQSLQKSLINQIF